jgi:calcineurin-like phosphoesterase
MPQRFEVARERMILHGAVIEIDDASGKVVKIQRVAEVVGN